MNKRTYKKYTEVYSSLRQYCHDVCCSGKSRILPGERELAAELHTSRMTLRKALEKAEMDGLIRRTKKLTEVLSQQPTLHKCGKILFISTGYRNEFTLGAFQRLWFSLKTHLENMGADFELLLTNTSTPKDKIISKCEDADIILLTVIQYNNICNSQNNIDFLVKMKSKKQSSHFLTPIWIVLIITLHWIITRPVNWLPKL
jgi:DNA-binding transcriptional MocR family regulator